MTEIRDQNRRHRPVGPDGWGRITPLLISDLCHLDGGVAQLGERLLCKQEVDGSSPFTSTPGESKAFAARQALAQQAPKAGGNSLDIAAE